MDSQHARRETNSASSGAPPNKRSKFEGYHHGGGQNLDHFLERGDGKLPPNSVLLITIINVQYPINVEIIYKVCSMAGGVRKIVCFERNNRTQAMVEFDTLESADKARSSLHGCDIYDNCCTMKVEYSKVPNLNIKENGPMSWDFTDRTNEPADRRPVILNRPAMGGGDMMGGGGGHQGGGGMGHMMMGGAAGGPPGGGGAGGQAMYGNGYANNMGSRTPTNPMLSGGGGGPMNNAAASTQLMNLMPSLLAASAANMGAAAGRYGHDGGHHGGGGHPHSIGRNGGGGGHPHEMMAHHSVERDMYGGGDDRTCVLMVYGLESDKWNPLLVFNLICQYGNVNKIFFMKNKESTAMVEMGDPDAADNVIKYVNEIDVFGTTVRFNHSKKHRRLTVTPLEFDLPNGSSSIKDFSRDKRMNRFIREDLARKNRLLKPTRVLHFYNVLRIPDEEFLGYFHEAGAPEPSNIKWADPKEGTRVTGSSGLLYFESGEDATDALVMMNHYKIGDRNIKLGYSPAKY